MARPEGRAPAAAAAASALPPHPRHLRLPRQPGALGYGQAGGREAGRRGGEQAQVGRLGEAASVLELLARCRPDSQRSKLLDAACCRGRTIRRHCLLPQVGGGIVAPHSEAGGQQRPQAAVCCLHHAIHDAGLHGRQPQNRERIRFRGQHSTCAHAHNSAVSASARQAPAAAPAAAGARGSLTGMSGGLRSRSTRPGPCRSSRRRCCRRRRRAAVAEAALEL